MSTTSQESSVLTPAAFLVRGLAAGLIAGLVSFLVAFAFGEPSVDDAIRLEESGAAPAVTLSAPNAPVAPVAAAAVAHGDGAVVSAHGGGQHTETHDDAGTVEITRAQQKSWGLLTGTVAIGAALGGVIALIAAATLGRLGRLSPRSSTVLVTTLGFVSFALVPFLKYPATPPAVGEEATIGARTAAYFAMVLISVVAMVAAVLLARRCSARTDGWTAAAIGGAGYLVVVAVAAALLPAVNEVGDFPADLLWSFRRSSLFTLAALWATLAVVLTALIGRLTDRASADRARRELAASL